MREGARDTTECKKVGGGACTTLSKDDERCFGDLGNCERYRAYIAGNGLSSSACVER